MSLNREAVYSALAALVFTNPIIDAAQGGYFVSTGRYLPHVATVDPNKCPALYMFQLPETREFFGAGAPPKRTLNVSFIAYLSRDNDAVLPAAEVNAAADVIDDVLTPSNPQNVITLGGLVEWVRIQPNMSPYEGLLQEKSVLVANIAMLVP